MTESIPNVTSIAKPSKLERAKATAKRLKKPVALVAVTAAAGAGAAYFGTRTGVRDALADLYVDATDKIDDVLPSNEE